MIWVDLCCGSAAVTLRLIGGPRCAPPAAYMGGKRRWAASILDHLGVRGRPPSRVIMCDAGPWGRFWRIVLSPRGAAATATELTKMSLRPEKGALLHHALVEAGQPSDDIAWAAAFIALQASAARGKPVVAHISGEWKSPGYAHLSNSARDRGFVERLQPGLLAHRVRRLAHLPWPTTTVHHQDARRLEPVPDAKVYFDPPYQNATGYQVALPRPDVELVAANWRAAGATVAVSEAAPLPWPGWHHAQPSDGGHAPRTFVQTPEWLTLSRPSGAPTQLGLLEVAMPRRSAR